MKQQNYFYRLNFIFALLSSVLVLGICSKCSPIYPFNDWVDANCFMTVGKSILQGLVPYKDLVEQKGPLLYIIHAIASLISDTSFVGMYFFEVLFAVIFLFLQGKILDLYNSRKNSYIWLPVIGAIVYSQRAFCHGNSSEEMCLPILTYALYVGLKAIKENRLPSKKEFLFIGLTSACMLWIKFSMLGFYIGWFLFFFGFAVRKKIVREFWLGILRICLGIFIVSLPILLYFLLNGAISDLFTAYFYNNIFAYTAAGNTTFSIWGTLIHYYWAIRDPSIRYAPIVCILIFTGLVYHLTAKQYKKLIFIVLALVCLMASVYSGKISYPYYALILSSFAYCGFILPSRVFSKIKSRIFSVAIAVILFVSSIIFAYAMSPNTYLLSFKKSDFPQYQFAEIIKKEENPTLLNYGFLDGGFYLTADVVPTCKYFCKLNANIPEMMEAQNEAVNKAMVDFVITRNEKLTSPDYKLVDESTFCYENSDRTYYLYQKISK